MNHRALFRIVALSNHITREADALCEGLFSAGISGMNARILAYLGAREGEYVFQRDLEEAFSIRRSTVSKIVQRMETIGLLTRESVEQDARLKRLALTDKARSLFTVARDELESFETRVLSALSADEQENLCLLLDKIDAKLTSETNH